MGRKPPTHVWQSPRRLATGILVGLVALTIPRSAVGQTDTTASSPQPVVTDDPPPSRSASASDGTWYPVPLILGAPASRSRPGPSRDASEPNRTQSSMGGRQKHSLVFDSQGQRFIAFGGWPGGSASPVNTVWERALGATGDWTEMMPTGVAPEARADHAAIYDPDGNRMIVFGGRGIAGPLNDVWVLGLGSSPQWIQMHPGGTAPDARSAHTAVLDRARHRVVIFGGRTSSGAVDDSWFLDLSGGMAWQPVPLEFFSIPPQRAEHVAVMDSVHARMVVYGGTGTSHYGDVWTLSLVSPIQWTNRVGNSPPGNREGAVADADPASNRMVVFGGMVGTSDRNDLWQLDFSSFAWFQLSPVSGSPLGRRDAGFAIDPISRTGVLSSGLTDQATVPDEAFALLLGVPQWTRILDLPPPPPPQLFPLTLVGGAGADRGGAGAAFDAGAGRYLLIGGDESNAATALRNDVQQLILGRDSTLKSRTVFSTSQGVVFTPRFGHTLIVDPLRYRVILFGGYDGSFRNDLWTVSLGETLVCAPLSSIGGPPPGRDFHSALYDPVGDRMIVFGGNGSAGPMNDVWELRLSGTPTWAQLPTTGASPSPRLAQQAVYDPAARCMLVFGGYDGHGVTNDLWRLSLDPGPVWSAPLLTGASPPPRHSHSLVYDSNRRRLVLFGGVDASHTFEDVWELPLGGTGLTWNALAPDGTPPGPRYGALALFDPIGDRMLASGGWNQGVTQPRVQRLQWSESPTATTATLRSSEVEPEFVRLCWDVASGPSAYSLERSVADGSWVECPAKRVSTVPLTLIDLTVVPGTRYGYRLVTFDPRGRTTSSEVWVETPRPELGLAGFVPDPVVGTPRVRFHAIGRAQVTIEILDVTGRRRAVRDLEIASSGSRTLEFAGLTLPPGVYLVRLVSGGRTLVRRGVILR